jgi:hypothetical protein
MSELLDFSWPVHRAGYELRSGDELGRESDPAGLFGSYKGPRMWLVPSSGNHPNDAETLNSLVDHREPLKSGLSIFMKFLGCSHTPEAALKFTEAHGFLFSDSYHEPQGEFLDKWLNHHEIMSSAVSNWDQNQDVWEMVEDFNKVNLGPLKTRLKGNRTGTSVSLVLQPESLWAMMWIEFAIHVSNKSGLRECEWCGSWFPYGTGTGRRSKARFCSDPCRKAKHAASKKENQSG